VDQIENLMNLTCNIDQRGRQARLITGIIVDTGGVGLLIAGVVMDRTAVIIIGAVVSLAGSFMIFEGARGWCALRALGVKTKL
jgi:hypothetical protein